MIKTLLFLLAAAALPLVGGASEVQPVVQSFDLRLDIDREDRSVRGTETIVMLPLGNDRAAFPLAGQIVQAVRSGAEPLEFTSDDWLTINLPEPAGAPPAVTFTIEYTAAAPSGVIFGERTTYSGFDTCTWMICDPSPSRRASFRLEIDAPAGEQVIASGELESVKPLPEGGRRFVWSQSEQYPAYLFGFALGPMRIFTTDVDGRQFTTASAALDLDALRLYTKTARGMVNYFESVAGMRLPHGRYTQVVVEGSAAQEKSTFSLLGTNQLAALTTDPTEDWLIAHELAHQFWGNLVTPRSWDEMWLSEGLVTFLTAAWKEQRWGRGAYAREMELARRRVQFAIDEGYDVPLAWTGEYPSLRHKRAIAYSRGALFFDHLRTLLGEEPFWRALRQFTSTWRDRSVGSRDLQEILERASERELTSVFDEWVYD